jgi:hypothetical protein
VQVRQQLLHIQLMCPTWLRHTTGCVQERHSAVGVVSRLLIQEATKLRGLTYIKVTWPAVLLCSCAAVLTGLYRAQCCLVLLHTMQLGSRVLLQYICRC